MTEFWLVSAPGENTPQKTWERLNQATSTGPEKLSVNYKFSIPELRVGTLDVLVGLSDDLGKLDTYCEGVTRKLAQYLGEVLEDTRDKLMENLKVGDGTPTSYLHKFTWDGAKYPIKQSLRFLAEMIGKQVSQIEADLKNKSSAYNNLKGNLQNLERKATGSLLTRSLADLVKKTDFVLDSEYLITLLVIVPKSAQNEWLNKYEKLTDMVVPRSSRLLFEDQESCLFNVTLFQRAMDEFKHHCRENKFVVRDFIYNEKEIEEGKTEVTRLEADKKKQYGPLVKWLRINFGECFAAWIHVKALRVFVESVLRYGLPVNFQAVIMVPNKRSQKRLREVLNQLYSHLDTTSMSGSDGSSMEIPGLNLGSADYYPYVFYRINLDLLDSQRL